MYTYIYTHVYKNTHTHLYIYIYTYKYMFKCTFVPGVMCSGQYMNSKVITYIHT